MSMQRTKMTSANIAIGDGKIRVICTHELEFYFDRNGDEKADWIVTSIFSPDLDLSYTEKEFFAQFGAELTNAAIYDAKPMTDGEQAEYALECQQAKFRSSDKSPVTREANALPVMGWSAAIEPEFF